MARKSFSIHSDFYEEIGRLPAIERGELFLALMNWTLGEKVSELNPVCSVLFRLILQRNSKIPLEADES